MNKSFKKSPTHKITQTYYTNIQTLYLPLTFLMMSKHLIEIPKNERSVPRWGSKDSFSFSTPTLKHSDIPI